MYSEITGHIVLVSGDDMEHNVTIGGAQMSTNVTGLQPGSEYTLRLVAVAMDGQMSPLSFALSATTALPGIALCLSCV